jgi:cell division protein ZapB
MATLTDLLQRVERLLLRHDELQRTNALLTEQLALVTQERDSLRSRLSAARQRIDTLIQRLPMDDSQGEGHA